jgi:hypothetical protein
MLENKKGEKASRIVIVYSVILGPYSIRMDDFQVGDYVKYITSNKNIYKGKITRYYGPNVASTFSSCPNCCSFTVEEAIIKPNTPEYTYPIGSEILVHKKFLVKEIGHVINSMAKNAAVREIYENKTGTSAAPGNGPANLIRKYAGIELPKGSRGGMRKHSRHTRRKLKTRKHRK